jgi:hypothetical protein
MLLTVSLCNPWFPEHETLNLNVGERTGNNMKKKQAQGEKVPLHMGSSMGWASAPTHREAPSTSRSGTSTLCPG